MRLCCWVLSTFVLAGCGLAQTTVRPPTGGRLVEGRAAYPVPAATSEGVLEEMSGRAAVIFAGTVTAVRLPGEQDAATGVVEVEFAVEQAVRGALAATYVVREWAGLWRDGARYQVGQRRLMLLHAPGPGGLSSPVDGMDGAIPVAGAVAAQAASAGLTASGVDLRWLAAKTMHSAGYADEPHPGVHVAAAEMGVAKQPELNHVMGLLRVWEAARNVAR